jgi:hypothetical protein
MTLWKDSEAAKKYRREWHREFRKRDPEYHRNMYKKHRDKRIKESQEWYSKNMIGSFENKIRALLYTAKRRAKEKGIEFSITVDDFEKTSLCPLLGIELSFSNKRGNTANSASIDRIDPSIGYVPGNVWVVSKRGNQIKNDATIEELEKVILNLKKKIHAQDA